jgi:hypothetical protein
VCGEGDSSASVGRGPVWAWGGGVLSLEGVGVRVWWVVAELRDLLNWMSSSEVSRESRRRE